MRLAVLACVALSLNAAAQFLDLPPRPADAPSGEAFALLLTNFPPPPDPRREEFIYQQITNGNVPGWLRKLVLIKTNATIHGTEHTVSYYVTPDYFCLGSDRDYFLQPMTPGLAQRVANLLGCSLPTRKMVKDIWQQAEVRMDPAPIPPGAEMVTAPVFLKHNQMVWEQRKSLLDAHPLGVLVAGDKKDIVISALMLTNFHRTKTPVVIFGWQKTNGVPIQPLYNGHTNSWADYSHGVRLVQEAIVVDGRPTIVSAVLTNPALAELLSDETNFPGHVIPRPYYPSSQPAR